MSTQHADKSKPQPTGQLKLIVAVCFGKFFKSSQGHNSLYNYLGITTAIKVYLAVVMFPGFL